MKLNKIHDFLWEIPKTGAMRVPGHIFASENMIEHIVKDKAVEQVANIATLPGIVGKALAMPDIHWGYGFPIGGVAAFDVDKGIISPGGIGYDINCGVRLLKTNLVYKEWHTKIEDIINNLFANIPSGVGSTGKIDIAPGEVREVLEKGAGWAVAKGFGTKEDLAHTEEEGNMAGADASCVSRRALERGQEQLGTLGAGNHFLEIQRVETVYDKAYAEACGIFEGQVTIMIHTGSRGLGYQVCDDNLEQFQGISKKYGISLPDKQLACAPISSEEGKRYFAAMSGAANYAWANRQAITHWIRETLTKCLGMSRDAIGLEVVYDVAHNIGKFEEHDGRKLFLHRKGATRAFPEGNTSVCSDYRDIGQPVLVPGTMGTESYILAGTKKAMKETFGSICHGAGRVMSRTQALKSSDGRKLTAELLQQGIVVKADSYRTLAEEAPFAYKDVSAVVKVCETAGIARKIAKLKPLGVIKG